MKVGMNQPIEIISERCVFAFHPSIFKKGGSYLEVRNGWMELIFILFHNNINKLIHPELHPFIPDGSPFAYFP